MAVVSELEQRFLTLPVSTVKREKAFVKLFGEYLRAENILQNYDEFATLKALQKVDISDPEAVETFKAEHYVDDENLLNYKPFVSRQNVKFRTIAQHTMISGTGSDAKKQQTTGINQPQTGMTWCLKLTCSSRRKLTGLHSWPDFRPQQREKGKEALTEEVRRLIRSSLGNRAKEGLIVDFIQQTNLDDMPDKASIIDAFFTYAQREQQREAEALIKEENLNEEAARRYIRTSLKREYATENGTELNETLPKLSPLNPQYKTKKQTVFQKIGAFIEKFKGLEDTSSSQIKEQCATAIYR